MNQLRVRFPGTAALLLFLIPLFSHGEEVTVKLEDNKSATVYYESYGDGLPVIMLHRGSKGYMEAVFAERENFRRIYIDPPGVGNSPAEEWMENADDCFKVLNAAVNRIVPDGRFAVGGFSYFGYMSRAVAAINPNRINGLLLMCPVTETDYAKRTLPAQVTTYTDSAFYNSLTREEQVKLDGFAVKNEESFNAVSRYYDQSIRLDTTLWNRIKRNNYAVSALQHQTPTEAPVLLLLGLQDVVVGYKDALLLMEWYPSLSLVVADYAGHSLPYEQYNLLKLHVNLWLDRVAIFERR